LQVLVTTLDGKLVVLDGKSGNLIWSPALAGEMKISGQAVVTSLNGRKIILVPLGSVGVVAFDWPSRREMWRSPASNPVMATPIIADLAHDGNREVIVGTTKGAAVVMRLADGKPLWHEQIADGFIEADPVVADLNNDGIDDLLLASHDFSLYAIDGKEIVSSWRKP
jgi:outer membrane protein assembly factor BamB